MTPPARALAGLRVLDFSIMMAGPYCGRLLADLGADVVKIEPPEGDDMRLRAPRRGADSTYFGQLNAGKRSVALDLKNPEALALARRLAGQADVVLENFRPGVMERVGLGAAALRALHPRLIYCSISGYGQSGLAAGRPAYAMIVQAASGFERTLMRYADDRERPAPTATFVADLLGAVYAFGAVQTALVQRARTGEGQTIDVALMDGMLNLLVYELQEAQFAVTTPRQTYGPVAAADGDLLVVPITERNFEAVCEVTGSAALRTDPRFATLPLRNANWQALMTAVQAWTRERPLAECLRLLEAAGVPCSAYAEPADALADPHLRERGVFQPVADASGVFLGVNAPWRLSASDARLGERVPRVGEHRASVIADWLAADDSELARLEAAGAFGELNPKP